MSKRIFRTVVILMAIGLGLTACSGSPSSVRHDQQVTNSQADRYQKNQPIPSSDFSEYRQNAIDIEQAQIHGLATTSFFYNQGANKPYKVCPSIGFPVPSTAQLTNPEQVVSAPNNGAATVAQEEPNGLYTGVSTGTYVDCVAPNGTRYFSYAEGFVHTEGGPAHFDSASGMIVDDGPPTVISHTKTR